MKIKFPVQVAKALVLVLRTYYIIHIIQGRVPGRKLTIPPMVIERFSHGAIWGCPQPCICASYLQWPGIHQKAEARVGRRGSWMVVFPERMRNRLFSSCLGFYTSLFSHRGRPCVTLGHPQSPLSPSISHFILRFIALFTQPSALYNINSRGGWGGMKGSSCSCLPDFTQA